MYRVYTERDHIINLSMHIYMKRFSIYFELKEKDRSMNEKQLKNY